MRKSLVILILFPPFFFACKKEKISEDHSELVGTWKELNGADQYAKLEIHSDSRGTLYDCRPEECGDIQFRKWRIKNNHLYYGISNDLGEIMQYPIIANADISIGGNDTIKTGDRYMILNYSHYIDLSH